MRALIADDDRMTVEILSRTLERWDFEVVAVLDGETAWE
jgi:DNA-binding response OmpR family regulator